MTCWRIWEERELVNSEVLERLDVSCSFMGNETSCGGGLGVVVVFRRVAGRRVRWIRAI